MLIMSFNVRGAYWENDGINFWPRRSALNVHTIQRLAPDVIGFQEFQDGNLEVYHTALPQYRFSRGPHYGNRAPFEYPAIAWRPERLNLTSTGGFWLSDTPEAYSRAWDTDCIRSAQWARFEGMEDGRTFVLLNTHLDHISAEAREQGARLIVSQLAQTVHPGEAVVVTGDFNCDPGSPPYQVYLEAGYVDTFSLAPASDQARPATYHGFRGDEYRPRDVRDERIDWILTRSVQPLSAKIVRDAEPPLYPSDHYPVVAELEL